jgi:alginate O-acetyltransferase complex protein AlgJ
MPTLSEFLAIERELALANLAILEQQYAQPYEALSRDQVAIAGVDGWLFIANGNNAWEQQYLGQLRISDEGMESWQRTFERRLSAAERIGARFAHLVIPEKQAINPDARWPAKKIAIAGPRPVLQLLQRIETGLVYPLEALQSESWHAELCFRGDSHWCVSGAWFGFCELMHMVWPERKFDFHRVPLKRTWQRHDLLRKYLDEECNESVLAIARKSNVIFDNQLAANTGALAGNHYVLQNDHAPYREAVVIFGDSYSFSEGFSDLLASFFAQVHFVWNTMVDFRYCQQVNAKLVLVESAERFIAKPHPEDLLPA